MTTQLHLFGSSYSQLTEFLAILYSPLLIHLYIILFELSTSRQQHPFLITYELLVRRNKAKFLLITRVQHRMIGRCTFAESHHQINEKNIFHKGAISFVAISFEIVKCRRHRTYSYLCRHLIRIMD